MSSTTKYEFQTFDYDVAMWDGLLTDFASAFDEHCHTYLEGTIGETFAIGEAGYIASDGKYYKATAGRGRPALGIAVDAGIANDEIRFQRVGPMTKSTWTWSVGVPVWLSPTTAGALTQTRPVNPIKRQFIGIPSAATTLILNIVADADTMMTTTTTTTTTTSTSSSSSSSTTSSTVSTTSSSSTTMSTTSSSSSTASSTTASSTSTSTSTTSTTSSTVSTTSSTASTSSTSSTSSTVSTTSTSSTTASTTSSSSSTASTTSTSTTTSSSTTSSSTSTSSSSSTISTTSSSSSTTSTTSSSTSTSTSTTTEYSPNWLGGYEQRIEVIIDQAQIDAALSDYPILIAISSACGQSDQDLTAIFDELGSDANRKKIAVTTSDGVTQCYVEIERWDDANELAWLWVKVPSISDTVNTSLWLYFDKDAPDNDAYVGDVGSTPGKAVWDSNFKAVYHLAEDPSTGGACTLDSTSNAKHGTPANMESGDLEDAKVGKGYHFGGTNEYVACPTTILTSGGTQITTQAWAKADSTSGEMRFIELSQVEPYVRFRFNNTAAGRVGLALHADATTIEKTSDSYTVTNWHFFEITGQESGNFKAFVDLTQIGTTSAITNFSNVEEGSPHIGSARDGSIPLTGYMDEVRISDIVRSDAWRKADYQTMTDNLLTFDTVETRTTSTSSTSSSSTTSSVSTTSSTASSTSTTSSSTTTSSTQSTSSTTTSSTTTTSSSSSTTTTSTQPPPIYADWDESSEAGIASNNTWVGLGENSSAGGNETGQGGGLSGDDLVLTQNGTIAGATGSPPSRACDGLDDYFTMTTNLSNMIANGTSTWTIILKIADASGIRTTNKGCAQLSNGNDYLWFGIEGGAGFTFLAYVDGVSKISTQTPVQPSTSGMLHIAMWCDGTYIRAGYVEAAGGSGENGQPVKWSDFPENNRVSATASATWQPGDFSNVRTIMRWAAGGNNLAGKFYYLLLSKDCLIDNTS